MDAAGVRDRLLLARSEELQQEYENLVRSLDSAYATVKAINCALSENRAESRRVFQERLSLASPPRLNPTSRQHDLRIHFSSDTVQGDGQNVLKRFITKYLDDAAGTRHRDAFVNAIFNNNNDSLTSGKQQQQQPQPQPQQQQQQHRCAGDAIAPSLVYSEQLQSAESPAVAQYSTAYVGDEHSYAVNDGCDQKDKEIDSKDEEQAAAAAACDGRVAAVPAGAAAVTVHRDSSEWRAIFGLEPCIEEAEVDLTIVKTEEPDEIEEPLIMPESLVVDVPPPSIKSQRAFSASAPKRARIRYRATQNMTDEELKKKRKQTRERMRRWRAKKKMQQAKREIASSL